MNDHGIRITNAQGKVTYDTTMVTWNQLATVDVPANGYGRTPLPAPEAWGETMVLMFFIDAPPIDRTAVAPNATIAPTSSTPGSGEMLITGGSERVLAIAFAR
jgi:hypothetical protein